MLTINIMIFRKNPNKTDEQRERESQLKIQKENIKKEMTNLIKSPHRSKLILQRASLEQSIKRVKSKIHTHEVHLWKETLSKDYPTLQSRQNEINKLFKDLWDWDAKLEQLNDEFEITESTIQALKKQWKAIKT